jgi:peptidoglycan/LPS O-acetylase OafA/YrhL
MPQPMLTFERIHWMDSMRGVSIALVIVFHTYGMASADAHASVPFIELFNDIFAPLRMPMMMFLSGMFVPQSLAKGLRTYAVGKLCNIAYPYLIWSAIMIGVIWAASANAGRRFEVTTIWCVFYEPIEHLWFLAYLFTYFMLALALCRVNPLLVAVVLFALASLPIGGTWFQFWYFGSFFMLGAAAVLHGEVWGRITRSLFASVALIGLPMVVFGILAANESPGHNPAMAPLVIAAVVGAAGVAMRVGNFRPVTYVGRNSIVFYLVHWPVAIGVSEAVHALFKLDVVALFVIVFVATLAVSWLASVVSDRHAAARALFALPRKGAAGLRQGNRRR